MRTQSPSLAVAVCAIALVLSPRALSAQYLDPGAGSVIVQAVIALTIGAAAAIKVYWRRASALLSEWRKRGGDRNGQS